MISRRASRSFRLLESRRTQVFHQEEVIQVFFVRYFYGFVHVLQICDSYAALLCGAGRDATKKHVISFLDSGRDIG